MFLLIPLLISVLTTPSHAYDRCFSAFIQMGEDLISLKGETPTRLRRQAIATALESKESHDLIEKKDYIAASKLIFDTLRAQNVPVFRPPNRIKNPKDLRLKMDEDLYLVIKEGEYAGKTDGEKEKGVYVSRPLFLIEGTYQTLGKALEYYKTRDSDLYAKLQKIAKHLYEVAYEEAFHAAQAGGRRRFVTETLPLTDRFLKTYPGIYSYSKLFLGDREFVKSEVEYLEYQLLYNPFPTHETMHELYDFITNHRELRTRAFAFFVASEEYQRLATPATKKLVEELRAWDPKLFKLPDDIFKNR